MAAVSLALWRRRAAYRKARHDHWQRLVDKARKDDTHPRQRLIDKRDHWSKMLADARAHIAALTLAGPATGVDVSNNNGHVDFNAIRGAGYRFVWLKASEGTGFTDRFFLDNVKRAKAAGLKVGAYHFLNAAPAVEQAHLFAGLVRAAGLGKGDLLPVIDVEKAGTTPAMAGRFIDALHHELRVFPLIYTFPGFAGAWPSDFGCKLWIAHFGARRPTIPRPWKGYAAWQHSSTSRVPGVSGNCDVNKAPSLAGLLW